MRLCHLLQLNLQLLFGYPKSWHNNLFGSVENLWCSCIGGGVLVWENKNDLNTECGCRGEFSGDDGGRQLIGESVES